MKGGKDSIVVTGMGLLSAIGSNPQEFWAALLSGASGAKDWADLRAEGFRSSVACRIADLESPELQRGRTMWRTAVGQALSQAGAANPPKATGVFVGSTIGESAAFEKAAQHPIDDLSAYSCFSFAQSTQADLQLSGPCRAYGTACTAGNYAIGSAARMLRKGQIKMAIAGGVDPFSRIAMAGFSRSRAMTSKGICRPFDEQRSGMLLGEGAAVLVLERAEDALARGAEPLAIIGALGLSCDAHHATAPEREGLQMARAFRSALSQQGIAAEAVDWICAHGSGTRISDAVEAKVIAAVFGEKQTQVCGIKGATGHSLGAATALEAVACIQGLREQMIPPTIHHEQGGADLPIVVRSSAESKKARWVLNCGYAFGGLNSALLIGSWN